MDADRCRLSLVPTLRYLEAVSYRLPADPAGRNRNLRRRSTGGRVRRSLPIDNLRDKFVSMILHVLPGDFQYLYRYKTVMDLHELNNLQIQDDSSSACKNQSLYQPVAE